MRISQQIFPRPVALITTISKEGKDNVATFSFLMPISFEPKYVAFSVSPNRHSFKNLKETKEFVMNILSKEMKKEAEICGSFSGKEKDKFVLAKLTKEKAEKVKPPLIKECPISFECKVVLMQEFGDHYLVVGKVEKEHIRNEEFEPLLHFSSETFATMKKLD
ncbi:MAG: flavin reductase family protein [Candidatus Parvarchaeota archaeon]|nr:flavin reductase family protein [Candidatus Jingweiarchaeum tengchongense]MCW1299725.1 flavin reductase family protein [Candidatus Jingweiarchaeum tengchongense]MCW1309344.1 flavin reductase family protein [Candidatus Jingweiarchaeum tengchongense]